MAESGIQSSEIPLVERAKEYRARIAISGAAPISSEVLRFFHAIGLAMREVYGQTEGSGPTAIHRGERIKLGTVGQPLPGVEVRIAEDGEILVRGPQVMKGYYNKPEETAAVIKDGWLYLGDVGRMDADGYLTIVDRKKDMIVAGGFNIYPKEIELLLDAQPGVLESAVIGVPHADLGETVVGLIVPHLVRPLTDRLPSSLILPSALAGALLGWVDPSDGSGPWLIDGHHRRALALADTSDFGVLRLIVDDTEKAKEALKKAGFTVGKTDVLAVEVPDRPGGLYDILNLLQARGINVEYMYAFVQHTGKDAVIIFRFDDIDTAVKLLQENHVKVLEGKTVYTL